MSSSEQRGFVFGVSFIVIFSVLIATIPLGLQGPAETPDMVTPLDASVVTGFSETENFTYSAFASGFYSYDLGSRSWIAGFVSGPVFSIAAKVLIAGFLWLGHIEITRFVTSSGINRGVELSNSEIATDAVNGVIRYSLEYVESGASAGGFVVYWNTTTYSTPSDAWDSDELYLLHGVGIEETAVEDMGALLIDLLLLRIPEVPLLLNIILIAPIWASVIFILWFIIKETIPFV